ncbi:MAG: hypothetical protein D6790_21885, partial [Caldilineae bacterium]
MPATVPIDSANALTINAGLGSDTIRFVTGLNAMWLPNLTVNGDAGSDLIHLPGTRLLVQTDQNLDMNLTDDAASGDVDRLLLEPVSRIFVTGTGNADIRVSGDIWLDYDCTINAEDGNLLIEANWNTSSSGNFAGIHLGPFTYLGVLNGATSSGAVTIRARGGDTGSGNHGIYSYGGSIIGGDSGPLVIEGAGGLSGGDDNAGLYFADHPQLHQVILGWGCDITVTGTGGGLGSSANNPGVFLEEMIHSDLGDLTLTGTGGGSTGTGNDGLVVDNYVTSEANITVSGMTGGGTDAVDIYVPQSLTAVAFYAPNGTVSLHSPVGGMTPSPTSGRLLVNGAQSAFAAGSRFNYHIHSASVQQPVNLFAPINLNGAELNVIGSGYVPQVGDVFMVAENFLPGPVQGTFSMNGVPLPQGAAITGLLGSSA